MYKIGIIGATESVTAFLALGVTVFEALTPADAAAQLHRAVATGEYAVLFIDEALAAAISEDIGRYKNDPLPAITVLPGKDGSKGYGAAAIKNAMERAIGADIL
jgi:V/A-type H+-transporting ATPase subunit F